MGATKREDKVMIASRIGAIAASTIALGFAAAPATAAELFSIKSSTFADGKMMPKKVANSKANAPTNAMQTASAITFRRNSPGAMCPTALKVSLF